MSDNNIKIQIATAADVSGVQQADKAFQLLDKSVSKTADGTATFNAGVTQVKKSTGNASQSLLLFSQGFEDAQYGIRGVLNNIPSLVIALGGTAGLAGALSIAAVGFSTVYEYLTKTDKKAAEAKKSVGDYAAELKKLYQEVEELGTADREQRAKSLADSNRQILDGIKAAGQTELGAGQVETARAKAENLLQLAQQRLELTRTEAALSLATGTKAVKLAKERQAIVRTIYETELATADIPRQAALAAAATKAKAAEATANAANTAASGANKGVQGVQQTVDELYKFVDELMKLRLEKVVKQQRLTEQIPGMEDKIDSEKSTFKQDIARLNKARDTLDSLPDQIADVDQKTATLIAQAEAKEGELAALKTAAETAAKAQDDAAKAMTEATRELNNLKSIQGIERQSERDLKSVAAQDEIRRTGQTVTDAATQAIEQIKAGAARAGVPTNPIENEAIGQLQQLVTDTTDDSKQGGQLGSILQSLANNLTGRDQVLISGIDNLITIAKSQAAAYAAVMARVGEALTLTTQASAQQRAINNGFKMQIEALKSALSQHHVGP